jgi:cellulose synthase/poly-beta-1,6-N-acetylglucosamine synthase-like glycosyltransferase
VDGTLLSGLTALFVFTQAVYFVSNLAADVVLYARETETVGDGASPDPKPTVHVLIPVLGESRAVLAETLTGIDGLTYPNEKLRVYLVTEAGDRTVDGYADELAVEFGARGLSVERTTVDRRIVETYLEDGTWRLSGDGVPRTKASALKFAFRTLSLPPEDVVTVFDADTVVPPDTFELAVAGLESHDVVQAKQTVRNHADGWLPRLEATAMAAWSHAVYAKTTRGPYQLLGKGYFVYVDDLWRLDDWRVDALTEDLTLGIDAYLAGYSLGVLDRYVQDICPTEFRSWVTQKRRWVAGPYPYLRSDDFTLRETLRFWVYAAVNQLVAVVNVVGVPAGVLYFLLFVAGTNLFTSPALALITTVNLAHWAYYSAKASRATADAVQFDSRRERLLFHLQSNPLTQLAYSTLWAVPIALAVRDRVRGTEPREFHVTPKRAGQVRSDRADD